MILDLPLGMNEIPPGIPAINYVVQLEHVQFIDGHGPTAPTRAYLIGKCVCCAKVYYKRTYAH